MSQIKPYVVRDNFPEYTPFFESLLAVLCFCNNSSKFFSFFGMVTVVLVLENFKVN